MKNWNILVFRAERGSYLNRIGQRDGDSQRQPLWDRHHQNSYTDDEELDKVLDVDGSALGHPRALLHHKVIDGKVEDQDDDRDGGHEQT